MDGFILATQPYLVVSDALISLWRDGRSVSDLRRLSPELAALDSRTISRAIKRQTAANGVSIHRQRNSEALPSVPEWWAPEIREAYLDGATVDEIAKMVKRKASTVRDWLEKLTTKDRLARKRKIAERKDTRTVSWNVRKTTNPEIGKIYVAQPSHDQKERIWWPVRCVDKARWQQLSQDKRWEDWPLMKHQAVWYAEILAEAMEEHDKG